MFLLALADHLLFTIANPHTSRLHQLFTSGGGLQHLIHDKSCTIELVLTGCMCCRLLSGLVRCCVSLTFLLASADHSLQPHTSHTPHHYSPSRTALDSWFGLGSDATPCPTHVHVHVHNPVHIPCDIHISL